MVKPETSPGVTSRADRKCTQVLTSTSLSCWASETIPRMMLATQPSLARGGAEASTGSGSLGSQPSFREHVAYQREAPLSV
jgi:hypothetical protein